MRKFAFLFTAIMAVLFYACSSDDKNDNQQLNGTTWELSTKYVFMKLDFHESTFDIISKVDDDEDGTFETVREGLGEYTYNAPHITMKLFGKTETGVVSGNKMMFEPDEDGNQSIFIKK